MLGLCAGVLIGIAIGALAEQCFGDDVRAGGRRAWRWFREVVW